MLYNNNDRGKYFESIFFVTFFFRKHIFSLFPKKVKSPSEGDKSLDGLI